jgi:hypothetical protein
MWRCVRNLKILLKLSVYIVETPDRPRDAPHTVDDSHPAAVHGDAVSSYARYTVG